MRLLGRQKVDALLLAVSTGLVAGCRSPVVDPTESSREYSPREPVAKQQGARVAPLFLHGKGNGWDGSPSMSRPLYLTKTEALPVIIEELSRYGVDLTEHKVVVDRVSFNWRKYYLVWKKDGSEDWDIISDAENSTTLAVDAADRKRRIAVVYIGWDNYLASGGVSKFNIETFDERTGKRGTLFVTAYKYDFPDAARYVRSQIEQQGRKPWHYGLFYDPVVTPRRKEAVESIPEPHENGTYSEAVDEAFKRAEEAAREEAYELLRAQVRDFVEWLRREGAI